MLVLNRILLKRKQRSERSILYGVSERRALKGVMCSEAWLMMICDNGMIRT